jgi:hypothetical protein
MSCQEPRGGSAHARCGTRWGVAVRAVAAALVAGAALAAPAAAVVVSGRSAVLAWAPTSGPVAGYAVYLDRDGSGFGQLPDRITLPDSPRVTVVGDYAGRVRVQVAAFDARGNFGPRSLPSAWIRFSQAGASTPGAGVPTDPSGQGPLLELGSAGSTQITSCGEPPILEGVEKVVVKQPGRDPREERPVAIAVGFCDGDWAVTTDQGLTLSGSYARRAGRARKLLLYLDGPSQAELRAALGLRASSLAGLPVAPRFEEPPYFRLQVRRQRVKLKAILHLVDAAGDELGRYKLRTAIDLGGS